MHDSQEASFFSPHGRVRRRTYVLRILGVGLPLSFINVLLTETGDLGGEALGALLVLVGSLTLLPTGVQRLHDLDMSGHWLWLSLVPLVNIMLGLYMIFRANTHGENRFGPDPRVAAVDAPPVRPTQSTKLPGPPKRAPQPPVGSREASEGTIAKQGQVAEPPARETMTPVKEAPAPRKEVPTAKAKRKKEVTTQTSPPPPPTPKVSRVEYEPGGIKSRGDEYPKWLLPKKGAAVQPPRHGKKGIKGYKEEEFFADLERHFGDRFQLHDDIVFATGKGTRPYEPDIVLHDPAVNLYVDIEIDEPYSGHTRRPTHCQGDDDVRDEVLVSRGWCVVRLPEILVHESPDDCCHLLAGLLKRILPGYVPPAAFTEAPAVPRIEPWDVLQAQRWAKERYREAYLGIDGFGVEQGEEIGVIADLTEDEDIVIEEAGPVRVRTNGSTAKGGTSPMPRDGEEVGTNRHVVDEGELAKANDHPRDRHVTFDPEEHRYYINGNPDTISVTTLIERHFPVFDTHRVAGKVAAKPSSKYFGRDPADIAREWEENGERSAQEGRRLHEQIEAHLNGLPVQADGPDYAYFWAFLADHPELEPYRTEWRIYDEYLMVAGTVDALFKRRDGAVVMYDWKRSKRIDTENSWESGLGPLGHLPNANYYRYALQQNIYREILRTRYGIGVDEMNLLVLHPSNDHYKAYPVDPMPEETRVIMRG